MNEAVIAILQRPAFVEAHISAAVQTAIVNPQEWTKVAGTTVLDGARGFDMPQAGRFRFIDSEAGRFGVSFAFSMISAVASDQFRFRVAKNGTTIERSEVRRFVSTPGDVGAAVCQCSVELRAGDFIELFAANWTDADDLTVEAMNVLAWSLGAL
jgi:hypothetical protein